MSIAEQMLKQRAEDAEAQARTFITRARNTLEAVKITIQEGDDDEAIRLIEEALGPEDDTPSPQLPLLGDET